MIFTPVDKFLWSLAIFIFIMSGIYYFFKGYRNEEFNEKVIMVGFASLWFSIAFTISFLNIADYFIEGDYLGHAFYGDYNIYDPIHEVINQVSYVGWIIGMTIFLFCVERVLKITRFSLTLLNIFSIVLIIIFPFDLSRIFVYILVVIDGIILGLMLLWFSFKSSQAFQAVLIFLLIGFFIIAIASASMIKTVKEMNLIPSVLPPILFIVGSLIVILPTVVNPDYFSQYLTYWLIFVAFDVILLSIALTFVIGFALDPLIFTMVCVAIVVLTLVTVYSVLRVNKILKIKNKKFDISKKEKTSQDILKIFTKPQKITEEEVTFHREQKICLVCKGKVSRLIYICPECDALYCVKCSQALSDLENTCWVCDTVIDESKPILEQERTIETHVAEDEPQVKLKAKKK